MDGLEDGGTCSMAQSTILSTLSDPNLQWNSIHSLSSNVLKTLAKSLLHPQALGSFQVLLGMRYPSYVKRFRLSNFFLIIEIKYYGLFFCSEFRRLEVRGTHGDLLGLITDKIKSRSNFRDDHHANVVCSCIIQKCFNFAFTN